MNIKGIEFGLAFSDERLSRIETVCISNAERKVSVGGHTIEGRSPCFKVGSWMLFAAEPVTKAASTVNRYLDAHLEWQYSSDARKRALRDQKAVVRVSYCSTLSIRRSSRPLLSY